MIYKVIINKRAIKILEKTNDPYYSAIKQALFGFISNPRPFGFKKLKGSDGYRIRVAGYRIIYDIFDDILLVNVIAIGHRKDVYE
jgi:mRNA interferase RelE/StbE